MIKYAILCTYPSGQQRLVSTFLEDDKDNISDEYMECLQGCNPHNYYEIVGVELAFLKNAPLKEANGFYSTTGQATLVSQSDESRVSESVHQA